MASYVMQLSGPRLAVRRPMSLAGIADPVIAHPIILLLGIVAGGFLATRKKRRAR